MPHRRPAPLSNGRLARGLHLLALCRQISIYDSLDRVPARLLTELGLERHA